MSSNLSSDELEGLRVSEAIRRGVLTERNELREHIARDTEYELRIERERDDLRTQNERLYGAALGLQDNVEKLQQQRAELVLKITHQQAEIERLRADLAAHHEADAGGEVLPGMFMCRVCKQVRLEQRQDPGQHHQQDDERDDRTGDQ